MKAVILAGGRGRRLCSESTGVAKPLIPIGNVPIICHVICYLEMFGVDCVIIALGFLGDQVTEKIIEYFATTSPLSRKDSPDGVTVEVEGRGLTLQFVTTGMETETAGRLLRVKPLLENERFLLTWCDGLTDMNIFEMHAYHKSHGKIATIAAVHPRSRFGIIHVDGGRVRDFTEKPIMRDRWVNGGYALLEPEIFSYIREERERWEWEPMQRLIADDQIMAWMHEGNWQCMDTLTDVDFLNALWNDQAAFWLPGGSR
jgi:glucose-1-phosphate cytidylyltransferase